MLLNSSDSCYLNSVPTALFHSARDLPETGLEAVFAEMRLREGAASRPLNLYTSFALPSRAVGWRFDALMGGNMMLRNFTQLWFRQEVLCSRLRGRLE